jgi:hypothetical protein
MQEAFLHYLWQFQQFDKMNLRTTANEKITVLKVGTLNSDAGPDFLNVRLMIGEIEWAGNVEIHLRSSDWNQHQHTANQAYNNVILHVVWEHNQAICRNDGSEIPTLSLKEITDESLLEKYKNLLEYPRTIPCAEQFSEVSELSKIATFDKALTKRLIQKSYFVEELLNKNNQDWEETAYQLLAKNFGFKLNSDAFLRLAQNLPLKILQKHRNNLFQIEALLFGLAGFESNDSADAYTLKLREEYQFLASKYQLKAQTIHASEWKFLRTRPANFPTIRLAQLAKLVATQYSFFSFFVQTTNFEELVKALRIQQSEYWQEHYHFNKKASRNLIGIGQDSAENIIINTVIPLLSTLAQKTDNQLLMERVVGFLEKLPAEENKITSLWKNLGMDIRNAFDSQASIELYNGFCLQKKCLQCHVGIEILRRK